MINIKDLIDNKTSYSTTRWAFVVCVRTVVIIAFITIITWIILSILGKPTEGLFGGSATLCGVIIGIVSTTKALQGFETKHDGNIIEDNKENKEEEDNGK